MDDLINELKQWINIMPHQLTEAVIDRKGELTFIIKTKETEQHHYKHLHIETSSASITINIENAEIINCSGKLTPTNKNNAIRWVKEHKNYLNNNYDLLSKGVKIPVY